MLSKNNRKLQEHKLEQKQRFGFRKYSFGLASALIGVSFMLTTGGTVSAATTTSTSRDATNITASSESTDTKSLEATDTAPTTATTDSSDTKTENTTSETSDSKSESTTTGSATDTPKTASTESTSSENKASSSTDRSASSVTSGSTSVLLAAATDASANKTDANATTTTDDAASAEGKITDEGKAKGLTDSDVTPGMSDANGASLKADNSNIPDGYKADPTEDRYTFGIISLGGDYDKWGIDNSKYKSYNGENNTHYYIRLSTKETATKTATNSTYDDTVYAQVVDATTDTVKWNQTLTPNSGAVKINNGTDGFGLSSLVNNVTQYYEINYSNTKIGNTFTPRIVINPNNGSLTSLVVYNNGKAVTAGTASPGTYVSVLYPTTGTIETEYIAKDAHNNETTLATYEETGRQGYTYTISGPRVIKGYDLISSPSTTTGTLAKTYNVGDVYAGGNLVLSDQLQLARVYVVTSNDGYAKVELRVALQKDADGNAITLDSVNDSSIWKTILSTDSLAPGAYGKNGNYGSGNSWYINTPNGTKYITDAGFTEEQLAGYKKHLTVIVLANGLTAGQEPAKYYYEPQGQVRINYVTSNGTVIQSPVSAYENSGTNTSYNVTGSTYRPETITVNGKTYRFVKSDKSLGKAGTTTVNGYYYNLTPSEAIGTITSNTVNDVYYEYEQVKYHTEAETKDVIRTIEYYDSVTGEPIPSNLESTVTQTATLNRNKIYDDQNNFVGYGTISADDSSYTIDNSWNVDAQTWTQQDSADLSDYGYTAPDRASVAAVTVDGKTTNVTEKVYYGHQTTPVTPTDPKTPGEPINPKGDVRYPDGVSKDDLTSTVKRTINYVDEDGNAVNGSPDGTSSYEQTAEFTRVAIVDKVTGKILGYDTNNDGKVDTESADRAWLPISKTLEAVKSADPSSVGYDNVDISNVSSLVVTPGQGDTTVTVTYSNNPVSGTIKYIDDTTGVLLDSDNLPTGKVGSIINYTTADKIKSYEDQGYELVSSDFTDGSQVYKKTGNDFVVYLKHKTQTITPNDPNPVTPGEPINPNDPNSPVYGEETDRKNLVKDASQTIHYVGAGDKTPADNVVTQKDAFTRTVTIDKVTGKVLSYTDWKGEKTFNTVDTPVVDDYHADKKVAGGLTATVNNPDVEETVTYSPNGKLVPVDPNGTPIPGADTPTYPTDPNDPTKVVPNEPIPDVPGWNPVDPSPVTPTNPGEDTPVPYAKKETPEVKYSLTEKFVDEDGNELLPSVNKGTDYKTGDSYDVTKDAKVVEGYVLVKTTDTTGTFTDSDKTAVFTYKKVGKIVPVDPNGNEIPGADTPSYKNDPDDPTKVVPNEPTPEVPGWTTDVPNVTPEDPTKDTPVPYAKKTIPSTPEVPSTPGTPSNPEVPSTPGTPSNPEVPSTPGTPSNPEEPTTPDTPSNPEEPTTPDTPSNPETPSTPDKPEVPSQPQKPVTPSVQNNPTPVNPTTTPASPKQTTLTGKQTPAPSKTVTANQLPQTGADKEKAILLSALGLGLVTLTSLLGLLGDKKRKH